MATAATTLACQPSLHRLAAYVWRQTWRAFKLLLLWGCAAWWASGVLFAQTLPAAKPVSPAKPLPAAKPVKAVRVCVQAIDYYPHYDFSNALARGFAPELLTRFFQQADIPFHWVALPIKRVYRSGECDLVYPDSPNWHAHEGQDARVYSQPLTTIIGSTLVRAGDSQRRLASIDSIAVPRGFTPDHLLKLQQANRFKLVETPDAAAALQMLLKHRVDAVDVEWHVARHLLRQLQQADAAEQGLHLPTVRVGFMVSTTQRPELISQLNQFLQRDSVWVKALTKRYQLTAVDAAKSPR